MNNLTNNDLYTLVYDHENYAYYFPKQHLAHWQYWLGLEDEDPETWEVPKYAISAGISTKKK